MMKLRMYGAQSYARGAERLVMIALAVTPIPIFFLLVFIAILELNVGTMRSLFPVTVENDLAGDRMVVAIIGIVVAGMDRTTGAHKGNGKRCRKQE
jgi:hypothetical protein